MEYREIGKTGCMGSIIGLGCEHMDGKPYDVTEGIIRASIESGINILDVFMPGTQVRENIGKALGAHRGDVMIQGHIGSTDVNQQYNICRDLPTVKKYFEELLRIYGYIDFGMMFFIDSNEDYDKVFNTGFADYVHKLKQNGDIRHIGFSSHNPIIATKVIETGLPEMMMFSINLAFDLHPAKDNVLDSLGSGLEVSAFGGIDPQRAALYKLCEQKNVGITVMKTLGAGKLLSKEHTPFEKPMTIEQCIHYALTRPAVSSVLLGCKSVDELKDALKYLDASDEEKDYSAVLGTLRNDFKGNCVYCSHCQPCPSGIDIAAVNKYLDIANLDTQNIPPSIKSHYLSLENRGKDCISCGNCESKCPFSVPIIDNMERANALFELPH